MAKRVRPKNDRVAALLRAALEAAELSIEDLGRITGWERNAGAFVRGEVQRPTPDQLNELAYRLPITVEQLLAAYGYNVAATPARRIYQPLAAFLEPLPIETQRALLRTLQDLATTGAGAQ